MRVKFIIPTIRFDQIVAGALNRLSQKIAMNAEIKIFSDRSALFKAVSNEFVTLTNQALQLNTKMNIALSGGSTPENLYKCLVTFPYLNSIFWNVVHIFWGDERCVPPNDVSSNYGMGKRLLLDHINIPRKNIHRICGEAKISEEVCRYSYEIKSNLPICENLFPQFDWILLGLGSDGHTASLFPDAPSLLEEKTICVAAVHPESGQKRISLTLPVINSSKRVSFLVTGEEKRNVVDKILKGRQQDSERYPAAKVKPCSGKLEWYLDKAAAGKLA